MDSTTRDRVISAVEWAVVVMLILGIVFAAARPISATIEQPRTFSPVRLERGETLWSIARAHPVEGLSTAELVQIIKRENDLSGGLYVGQVVSVPVAQTDAASAVCAR